ncbi:MAG: hypothetical protein AAFX79_08415 [Planctomycetota bacterium]
MFPVDPASFWSLVFGQLVGASPMLIVEILGLILGFAYMHRAHRAGVLVVIACAASLLNEFVFVFGYAWLSHRMYTEEFVVDFAPWFTALAVGTTLIRAGALGLLVFAALSGRTAAAHPHHSEAATGASTGLPPGVSSRISKGLFLGSIYGSAIAVWATMVPLVVLMVQNDRDAESVLLGLSCFVVLLTVYSAAMLMVLLYKLWATIQPASTSAGRAIGLLFIPFFNLYWVFRVYRGWSVEANRFVAEHGVEAPRSNVGLATAVSVLLVISVIPYAGLPFGLIASILAFFHLDRAITIANAIRRLRAPSIAGADVSGM